MQNYIIISSKPNETFKSGDSERYDVLNFKDTGFDSVFHNTVTNEWMADEESGPIGESSIIKVDDDKWGILKYVLTRKGQFTRAAWCRTAKTRKGSPEVKKMTISTVRAGVDYNALTAVEALRANGDLPSEPQPLPWGSWLFFPFIIVHKGVLYLRLYPSTNANTEIQFFLEEKEVPYEKVEDYLLASEKPKDDDNPVDNLCFNVKLNDVIEIY